MKIKIELHQQEFEPGQFETYYKVKFKSGWWSMWRYKKRRHRGGPPEDLELSSLEDAKLVAKRIRWEHNGPKHTIRELNEKGEF